MAKIKNHHNHSRQNNSCSRNFFSPALFILIGFLTFASAGFSHAAEMDDYPIVKLRSLDKVTARTVTFEAHVGSTVKFGPLYIKVQACRKAPPIESPESAAFLQIWEVTPADEAQWVFSGWMFASSPGLSPMDHPIYDVWVLDCLETKAPQAEAAKQEEEAAPGEGVVEEDEVPQKPAEKMAEPAAEVQPVIDSEVAPEPQVAPALESAPEAPPEPEVDTGPYDAREIAPVEEPVSAQ